MKQSFICSPVAMLVIAIAISLSLPGVAAIADEGDSVTQPQHYLVKLLGTRPGWPENMTAEEERIMGEHFVYLHDLVAKKKVLTAGPVFEPVFGLIILQVESRQEAVVLMDQEPSVRQGVHTYELHPMRVSLLVEYQSPQRYVADPSDRVLRKETIVPASLDEVWEAWTTTPGVKTFFASAAEVSLEIGGKYEICFNIAAPQGLRGSEGCRILSYLPQEMLSFEWNAPPDFGDLRQKHTRVVVQLTEPAPGQVKVLLSHLGWGRGEDWDKLYDYFDKAWGWVLENLKKRFTEGPIDWSNL